MDVIFKALADATRVSVIESLSLGEKTVGELAAPFEMALPSFMQHLSILEQAGIIATRKEGRVRHCRLQTTELKSAESWLNTQRQNWTTRLDQLDSYLITMEAIRND